MGSAARQLLGAAGVIAIALLALSIALGGPGRLLEELASVDPLVLAASVSLLTVAEAVKALRLCTLADRGVGALRACLLARLLGRAAASVTPAGIGGIPARTAVLASEARIEFGRAFGASVGETLADNALAIAALAAGALFGVMNPIVLGVASVIAFIWILGLMLGSSDRVIGAAYRRLRINSGLRCTLERERAAALAALRILLAPRRALVVLATTLASHMLEYTSVIVFSGAWSDAWSWLHAILAVEAGYMMVFTPAPGGGGGVEYALVSYLGPQLALYWRLSYLIAALAPLALAYIAFPRLREYLGEYGVEGGCEGDINAPATGGGGG